MYTFYTTHNIIYIYINYTHHTSILPVDLQVAISAPAFSTSRNEAALVKPRISSGTCVAVGVKLMVDVRRLYVHSMILCIGNIDTKSTVIIRTPPLQL